MSPKLIARLLPLPPASPDLYALGVKRDGHYYAFLFTAEYVSEVKRTIGRFAGDPRLNFTWYDAAVLCQKLGDEFDG